MHYDSHLELMLQLLLVKRRSPNIMEIKEKYQKTSDSKKGFETACFESKRPTIVSKPRTNSFEKGIVRFNGSIKTYAKKYITFNGIE